MSRPLLYLDVDGPLNPYAAKPERRPAGYTTHRMKPQAWTDQHPGTPPAYDKPLRVWLNPGHGPRLLDLGRVYDLVWATTWGAEANTFIAPVLGLPRLPVVAWPTQSNLPATAPVADLARWAKMRRRIGHDHRGLKHGRGPGHFEGRTWRGRHHHVTLVTAAQAFLTPRR